MQGMSTPGSMSSSINVLGYSFVWIPVLTFHMYPSSFLGVDHFATHN